MLKFSESKESEKLWSELRESSNRELVDAIRELYSIYDSELVDWVAGLFDTEVGGFYYSNSARDNEKTVWQDKEYILLPDAESTCQAIGFINSSGIANSKGGAYGDFLPEWAKVKIADYIYGLQDPDGFFYHPQWGKNIANSRRARDLSWSINMLSGFERKLKYPTILDKKEEKTEDTLIPDHLSSREKLIEYLDSLDVAHNSYSAGNQISSQFAQAQSVGLGDVIIDYLNALQHPETGHWHSESNYYAVNGLMKISGIYNRAGLVIPHSMEAAMSAIEAITSGEEIRGVVDLWNTWVAVHNIQNSLRTFGGADGVREADEIRETLKRRAVGAVRVTKEKILPFKQPDFAFSYTRKYPAPTSQGAPVCIPYLPEGDMNATVISVTLMIQMVYNALGLRDKLVPLFGDKEGERFIDIIESNRKK